jgi:hypothetical protein
MLHVGRRISRVTWELTLDEAAHLEAFRATRRRDHDIAYKRRRAATLRELKDAAELRQFQQQIQREGRSIIAALVRQYRRALR